MLLVIGLEKDGNLLFASEAIPMSFLDLAARRRSTRSFSTEPVERERIARCLEAARLAPSAGNGQPWRFVVVDEPKLRAAVAAAAVNETLGINRFVPQAPVLVAVVMEPTRAYVRIGGILKGKDYRPFDIGMAVMQFCLQAEEEGLGTCIIGWFDEGKVRRLLGVPRGRRIPLLIALGRPGEEENRPKQRKIMAEICSYNRY
ncbi:MAG: nitroreductase family protein [Bacillota bacterium]